MSNVDTEADTEPPPVPPPNLRCADAPCDGCKKHPWTQRLQATVTRTDQQGRIIESRETLFLCDTCATG